MNEFLNQFLLESRELVEQASDDLLALEKAPGDRGRLDSAFRAFHTLKGGAGIVDFAAMENAVHAAEGLLEGARSGSQQITSAMIGDCLACLDQVIQWLDAIELAGELPADADEHSRAIAEQLTRLTGDRSAAAPGRALEDWVSAALARHPGLRGRACAAVRYAPDADCFFRGEDPLARIGALPGLLLLELEAAAPWPVLDALDPFSCNLVLNALTEIPITEAEEALRGAFGPCETRALSAAEDAIGQKPLSALARDLLQGQIALLGETAADGAVGRMASAALAAANVLRHNGWTADADRIARMAAGQAAGNTPDVLRQAIGALLADAAPSTAILAPGGLDRTARTLRVDAARIDALVSLTGELTVAKNAIGHASKLAQETNNTLATVLKDRHAVLDRLVGELQRSVLRIRVLPLRHVFQRFPRLMREMSADLGKPVNLVIEGEDTEADKLIVEMLFEPLVHLLRNAMDHGVEDASARSRSGKPPVATIRMTARRQGENVVVEVSDDGRGMDVGRIRQVARARGEVAEETLAAMSDAEVVDLVFAPGFSTSAEVTGLSGRGVGMDAVRTAVEKLAGQVAIETRAGNGTTVRFTLPFSMMMTRVMTVEAGGQMFGIPLDAIVETIRVDAGAIAGVGAAHAIVLRNRTMPLVELADALGIKRHQFDEPEATVVVARIDGAFGALRVDRLGERMEVMLKPLDGLLSGMPGIAGSTLLGDGSVLLVLDIWELLQ